MRGALPLLLLLSGCLLPQGGPLDDGEAWDVALAEAFGHGDRVEMINGLGHERDTEQGLEGDPLDGRAEHWTWHVCIDGRFAEIDVRGRAASLQFGDGECRGIQQPDVGSTEAAAILRSNGVTVPDDATRVAWLLDQPDGTPRWSLLISSPGGDARFEVDAEDGTYLGKSV